MVDLVVDLRPEFPIVDPETGIITPEFLRFLQERGGFLSGAAEETTQVIASAWIVTGKQ